MKRFCLSALLCLFAFSSMPVKAELVLLDNFEFTVSREQTGKSAAFASGGGWTYVKSRPEEPGACGYLYTTNSLPGYSGIFPGINSTRVLAMEFLPVSLNCLVGPDWYQTDLYLAKGGQGTPQNTIPPDLWVQYWIYINDYGTQQTSMEGGETKWLYPCIDGMSTCTGTNVSFLHVLRPRSSNPFYLSATGPDCFPYLEGNGAYYAPGDPEPGPQKLGINVDPGVGLLTANRWILVKINIDISGTQGSWQEWHKLVGGNFVQIANWVGGVTPDFTWPLSGMNPTRTIGQKSMKLGTTWNNTDGWIYLDDFVMASTEQDLPVYGGSTSIPPLSPRGLIVR